MSPETVHAALAVIAFVVLAVVLEKMRTRKAMKTVVVIAAAGLLVGFIARAIDQDLFVFGMVAGWVSAALMLFIGDPA